MPRADREVRPGLRLPIIQPAVARDHCVQVEDPSKMAEIEARGRFPSGIFWRLRSRNSFGRQEKSSPQE
jgi:hypothetical protein